MQIGKLSQLEFLISPLVYTVLRRLGADNAITSFFDTSIQSTIDVRPGLRTSILCKFYWSPAGVSLINGIGESRETDTQLTGNS